MSTMMPEARDPVFLTETVIDVVAPGVTGSGDADVPTTEKLGAALAPVTPSAPRTATKATSVRTDVPSKRRICISIIADRPRGVARSGR